MDLNPTPKCFVPHENYILKKIITKEILVHEGIYKCEQQCLVVNICNKI
jgi:hypothetical protein